MFNKNRHASVAKTVEEASLVGHRVKAVPVPSPACVCGGFPPASLSSRASRLSPTFGPGSCCHCWSPRCHGDQACSCFLLAKPPSQQPACQCVLTYREEGGVDTAESRPEASSMASLWECLESAVLRLNGAPSLAKHGISHLWQCVSGESPWYK